MGVERVSADARLAENEYIAPSEEQWVSWFERHWLLVLNTFWGIFVVTPWTAPIFVKLGWTAPARAVYFIYNFFCHQLPERSWFLFGPQISYTKPQIGQVWDISNELVRRQFVGTPSMGWKVAWSDRMVAMYGVIFILGLVYALLRARGIFVKGIPWWAFFLLIAPLGVDGTTHLINDMFRLSFRDTNQWAVIFTNGIFPASFYPGDMFGSLNSVLRLATGFLFGLGTVWFMWPIMEEEFGVE